MPRYFLKIAALAFAICVYVGADQAQAQSADLLSKIAVAEEEYVKACKRLDDIQERIIDGPQAHLALDEKIAGWEARVRTGFSTELNKLVESGVLVRTEPNLILDGNMVSHENGDVQNLINRRQSILGKIEAFRNLPEHQEIYAAAQANAREYLRQINAKRRAGEQLELLKEKLSSTETIVDAEKEEKDAAEIERLTKFMMTTGRIDQFRKIRTFRQSRAATQQERVIEREIFELTSFEELITGQLRDAEDRTTQEELDRLAEQEREDNPGPPPGDLRAFHAGFGIGLPFDPGATFEDVSQGLNTDTGIVWDVNLQFPTQLRIVPNWDTWITANLSGGDIPQNGHFNIPSGAVGPSTGNVNFLALTGGLSLSRPVGERGEVAFDLGGGLGRFNVGGTFNANGTVPVARVGATYRHEIAPGVHAGPYAAALFPLGKIESGFSGTNSVKLDPIFTLGVTFNFNTGRRR